jgi:hypothetical protein
MTLVVLPGQVLDARARPVPERQVRCPAPGVREHDRLSVRGEAERELTAAARRMLI